MLPDVEAELEQEIRVLRADLIREVRARELRAEIGNLAAATSSQVTRAGVAEVIASGAAHVFDAAFVFVCFVGDEDMVRLVAGPGVPDSVADDWREAPLSTPVPVCDVLRGDADFVEIAGVEEMEPWPILVDEIERTGMRSMCVGGVGSGERPAAAIIVAWSEPHLMDDAEAELLALLTRLSAPAFERSLRTEADGRLANTVQSWLREGTIAEVDGLDVATLYEPGKDILRVGGDWFDVLLLDSGGAAVVIGDVVGHDVKAAIEMSQVRHVLASQLKASGDAVEALASTDRYLRDRAPHIMATALVAVFDLEGGLSLASAGHPPPVIALVGGATRLGGCGLGPPLGTGMGGYSSESGHVDPGDLLCAYTDGIVEERDTSIDSGIERLRQRLAEVAGSPDPSPDAVVSMLLDVVDTPTRTDDAAAVIARVTR